MKKILYVFISVFVLLGILGGAFYLGLYPALYVNGKIVLMKDYKKGVDMAYRYYKKFAAEQKQDVKDEDLAILAKQMMASSIVDGVIIESEARNEIGNKYDELVSKYVDSAMNDEEIVNNMINVFDGADKDTIKKYFVEEKARMQVVKEQLFPDDDSGDKELDWVMKLREKANVKIYISGLAWDGAKGVVLK